MRQFWIKNAKGQVFDMNREDAFFSNPKGLGISRKSTYDRAGYFWMERESVLSQKKPSGNMVFDGYEQYDEFLKIIRHTPVTLIYQPLDTMYFMDVNTFTIDKGDISHRDCFLTCKVTFDGSSPWYTTKKVMRQETGQSAKIYSYQYPYSYMDYSVGEADLVNESGMDAYCKLVIYGPLKAPFWRLYQDNAVVSDGAMFSEISADSCLVVDANPQKYEIAEYSLAEYGIAGEKIRDRYEESDFDTGRFLYLPQGKTKLRISHAGSAKVRFCVEVTEFAG